MDVEFDPVKDAINLEKHGLSLADAAGLDLLTAAVIVDDRRDYGETRYRAVGRIDGGGVLSRLHGARYHTAPDQLSSGP